MRSQRLHPEPDARRAVRALCRTRLVDIQASSERLRRRGDATSVHKMRVAIQRLRVVLKAFASSFPANTAQHAIRDLARLRLILGAVRDHDLLSRRLASPAAAFDDRKGRAASSAARRIVQLSRRRAHQQLIRALESKRCLLLMGRLQALFADSLDQKPVVGGDSFTVIAEMAMIAAKRRAQRLYVACGAEVTAAKAHRLRRAIKQLRYLSEALLSPISDDMPVAMRALVAAQDVLGDLQDHVVVADLAQEVVRHSRSPNVGDARACDVLLRVAQTAKECVDQSTGSGIQQAWEAVGMPTALDVIERAGKRLAEHSRNAAARALAPGRRAATRIYLLRHAMAVPAGPRQDDADRPLTGEGRKQCQQVADLLGHVKAAPDLVVSSPARRARETASAVLRALGMEGEVVIDEALRPSASTAELLAAAQNWRARVVLVVGHEPGLSSLAAALIGNHATRLRLRKAGWIEIELVQQLPLRGTLAGMVRPRYFPPRSSQSRNLRRVRHGR